MSEEVRMRVVPQENVFSLQGGVHQRWRPRRQCVRWTRWWQQAECESVRKRRLGKKKNPLSKDNYCHKMK